MFKLPKSIIKSTGKAIKEDPEVNRLRNKFPNISRFVKQRLSPDEKFGLYLTIGIIISFIFTFLFFSVVNSLEKQKPLIQADSRIINLFESIRAPELNDIMLFITYLGE